MSKWGLGAILGSEDDWYVESVCEAGFVVDAATRAIIAVGEVCDDESGAAYLGDDLVCDRIAKVLAVNAEGIVARGHDCGIDGVVVDIGHGVIEPHRDESLGRVSARGELCDARVSRRGL